ncbi:MAG: hypothetical protein M4579_000923 [Chaenotheca gracillima]|nr:MAG: hypothetical protein M4579_000923 [Chaenotheca gracillima]
MKDLFRAHPQKSNLWLHCGRLDDIIVLSNGEKLNPITMELAIQASPLIRSALIIGQGKSQPALIIETVVSGMHFNNASYLKKIWPYIRAANRTCPAHGRVSKSLVAFATEDKPLIRNGKGSVVRSQTELAFKAEIKTLYDTFEQALDGVEKTVIKRDVGEMQIILFELVAKSLGIPVGSQQDDDFFDIGMDSIQVIELNRRLNAVVDHRGHSMFAVDTSTIYQYPTTQKLIHQLIHGVDSDSDVRRKDPRILTMQNTLKWITSSPPSTSRWIAADITEKVVILTGSSGNLGSYILQSLIACEEFESIYCFNRSEVPASHFGPHSSRVHFVKVDLAKKYFGMNGDLYQYLLGSATHIVHNAWQVDFNLKLESFSPQLEGVRNLVAFAAHSSRRPHIFFISSVSSIQNPQRPAIDPVLEKVYEIFAMAQSLGYGESKHISERLLAKATKTSAVPCSIFRVAQIAGPLHAEKPWNASEWLPSLIASCKFMKSIPSSLGVMESIDWIPVDSLANIITELITGTEKTNYDMEAQTHVYHLVNPTPTTWRDLLPIIRAHLGPDIEPIPFRAWVDLLNETACSTTVVRDAMHNPAVKLLRFFVQAAYSKQKYPKLDTTIATACSSTLRELGPVTPEWMALWMHQWGYMLPGGTG